MTTMRHLLTSLLQKIASVLLHLSQELVIHGHDGDTPAFERGWPELPAEWLICPEAVKLMTPAIQLQDLLRHLLPCSSQLTFDDTLCLQGAEDSWRSAIKALHS